VIISCPSCGTRYRHPAVAGAVAPTARCSACERVFSVPVRAGRPYVVIDGGAPARGGSAARAAGRGRGRRPEPGAPVAGRPVARLAIGMDDPSLAAQLERTALDGDGSPMTYRLESVAPAGRDRAPADRDGGAPAPAVRQRGRVWRAAAVLVVGALGAAAGWLLAGRSGADPRIWAAGAGVAGLFLAWTTLRWKRRKS
jgi:hypothetical protein